MSHFLLNRYSNALNHTKVQRTIRECNTGTTLYDKDDIKAREGVIHDNKRARWRGEILDQIPPERVYMVIGEVPKTKDVPGASSGAQVGVSNSYIVTQRSNIVWNRVTKRWEYMSYSQNAAPSVNTVSKKVRAGWGNGKSRQGGGQ